MHAAPWTERLLKGQFTTPDHVADLGYDAAVRAPDARLWEPTCGDGSFLDAALRAGHHPGAILGTEIDSARLSAARVRRPDLDLRLADLFALSPADLGSFDAIVGNPPFVRPERMDRADRERIRAAVRGSTGFDPPGKADLAVLALLHCLAFLKPGGRLSFVMPNSWMDADFGAPVRRFVRQHHRVLEIMESRAEPWFPEVSVNTVIVVLQRTDQRGPTKFTQFTDGAPRTHRRDPGDGRWTVPMRAPTSYWRALDHGGLQPLQDALELGYGAKVGIAPFFTPRRKSKRADRVESRWRRPFLRTLRGVHRYEVGPDDVRGVLFDFSADPEAAADPSKNPGAAAWIAWGAKRRNRSGARFPDVRSVRHHQPWYAVRTLKSGPLLLPQFRADRHYIATNPEAIPVNNSAWWARWKTPPAPDVGAGLLNCTWMALAAEVLGRTNLGEGLLTLYGPDLKALPVPVVDAPAVGAAFAAMKQRPVLSLKDELRRPDRRALDDAVGDALGWPKDLVDAVRADALRMQTERLRLAARLRDARNLPLPPPDEPR